MRVPPRTSKRFASKSYISVALPIKSLTNEATGMDNKTFTEQERLEGLDAHTAHADEWADLVKEEVGLDEINEDGSYE